MGQCPCFAGVRQRSLARSLCTDKGITTELLKSRDIVPPVDTTSGCRAVAPPQLDDSDSEGDASDEDDGPPVTTAPLGSDGLPSVGSKDHVAGDCKRCCFFPKGRCQNGHSCTFCHYDHSKRKRLKKKSKRTAGSESATPLANPAGMDIGAEGAVNVGTPHRGAVPQLPVSPSKAPSTPTVVLLAPATLSSGSHEVHGLYPSAPAPVGVLPIVAGPPPAAPPALQGLPAAREPPPPPPPLDAVRSAGTPNAQEAGSILATPSPQPGATPRPRTPISLNEMFAEADDATAAAAGAAPGGHQAWAAAVPPSAPPTPQSMHGWPHGVPALPGVSGGIVAPHFWAQQQELMGQHAAYLGQLGYHGFLPMPGLPAQPQYQGLQQDLGAFLPSSPHVAATPSWSNGSMHATAAPPLVHSYSRLPDVTSVPLSVGPRLVGDFERDSARSVLMAMVGANGGSAGVAPLDAAAVFSKAKLLGFRKAAQSRRPPGPLRSMRVVPREVK